MRRFSWIGAMALVVAMSALGCSKTDPGITTAVKTKLAADDTVKAHQINVDTKDHIVTLSGSVDSANAKERAVQLARTTDGVGSVVDNLMVSPPATSTTGIGETVTDTTNRVGEQIDDAQKKAGEVASKTGAAITDAAVTSAVKTKFLADSRVAGLKIDVDTKDGVVTLSGDIASVAEGQRAVAVARDTSGVRSVVDRMKVR